MIISQDLVEMHEWEKRRFLPPVPALVRQNTISRHAVPDALWFEVSGSKSDVTDFAGANFPAALVIVRGEATKPTISGNQIFHFGPEVEPVLAALLRSITGNVNVYINRNCVPAGADPAATDNAVLSAARMAMQPNPRLQARKLLVDQLFSTATPPQGSALVDALVDEARANGWAWCVEHGMFIASGA